MIAASVDRIAKALLYEGYALFPYTAGATKNRARCSFGELVPRGCAAYGRSCASGEVLAALGPGATLELRLAFLQPVRRRLDGAGPDVWEAARERAFDVGPIAGEGGRCFRFEAPDDAPDGESRRLSAELQVQIDPVPGAIRGASVVRVSVANATEGGLPEERSLASIHAAHLVVRVSNGSLVSAIDPPSELAEANAELEPDGLWPILVGPPGDASTVLFSPIILQDHPAIAAESFGDLFDATENDELLTLSILALTDEERARARATDPRVCAILDRCEALGERLGQLHGAVRSFRSSGNGRRGPLVRVGDSLLGEGDAVRLRTRRGDVFDDHLFGRRATIVGVDVEVSGREHLVVVVDGDPGRELGELELGVGHRFYVGPDEVEVLDHSTREDR